MGRPKTMAGRKIVSLTPELQQAVEDFRFVERIKTESDALRQLIELGLQAARRNAEASAIDEEGSGPEVALRSCSGCV